MRDLLLLGIFIGCLNVLTASACNNGERAAIDGSCKYFMECVEGSMQEKSCGFGHAFDKDKSECRWSFLVNCEEKSHECEDGKLYPHPNSCRLYYLCRGDRLELQFCSLLKVFQPTEGKCNFGFSCDKVDCTAKESRSVPGECGSYEQCNNGAWEKHSCLPLFKFNPISEQCEVGGCKQCAQGATIPGAKCDTFQYCDGGVWNDDQCALLRRFDPSKGQCVWWFQYTCPTTTSLLVASPCKDGTTKAYKNRSKYSICKNGVWSLKKCPKEYIFDEDSRRCIPKRLLINQRTNQPTNQQTN